MMLNKTITLAAAMVAVAAMGGLSGQSAVAQYGQPNQYPDRNYQNQYQDRGRPASELRQVGAE